MFSSPAEKKLILRILALGVAILASAPAFAEMTRPERRVIVTDFGTLMNEIRSEALQAGIPAQVIDTTLAGIEPPEPDDREPQPEFSETIWSYLDRAVSPAKIDHGKAQSRRHRTLLNRIEQETGVQKEVLLAIWAAESNYGVFRGSRNVFETLVHRAFSGQRADLSRAELIAAMRIVVAGGNPATMTSGAGGAMGHMQFLPSTYLAYAADGDGDGDRNIWEDDPADALASAASYLHALGWRRGLPWGMEVHLPEGFDWQLVGEYQTRPTQFWQERGVKLKDGNPLPDLGEVALIAPAGARGPVLAVTQNFAMLRIYNKSVSYALSVGHLADRIGGGRGFRIGWPRGERALTPMEQEEIQGILAGLGYEPGPVDGRIGPATIEAIQAWQAANGLLPDGFATAGLLTRLRAAE